MTIKNQIYITTILTVIVVILFGIFSLDTTIQDNFFNSYTNTWILDSNLQPYKFIFYDGIKKLLVLFALSLLVLSMLFYKTKIIQTYKHGIIIVILSAIIIPFSIGGLKKITNMPCPKNEIIYGGKMIRTAVWERYTSPYDKMPTIKCWPAGHASGGFALLSLFFLFKTRKNKLISLAFALTIGWSMGSYKMLIGDHFFSHTVITMMLSWLIILIIALITNNRNKNEKSTKI